MNALGLTGIKYKHRFVKNENEIFPTGSIIFIDYSIKYPFGHYLVKSKKGFMDPWLNIHNEPRRAGFRTKLPGKPIYITEKN